ncbi:hypothetical protein Q3G72_003601 [Acer saccharum]|nr:hypothetical protein Q3G72_003601 [Acer saccharum]
MVYHIIHFSPCRSNIGLINPSVMVFVKNGPSDMTRGQNDLDAPCGAGLEVVVWMWWRCGFRGGGGGGGGGGRFGCRFGGVKLEAAEVEVAMVWIWLPIWRRWCGFDYGSGVGLEVAVVWVWNHTAIF